MHVLFLHQNYPAQFGHVAQRLGERHGWRCTFVSQKPAGRVGAVDCLTYRPQGGATKTTHYCARTFENAIGHSHGIFEALKQRPDVVPDRIVAHSGFFTSVFLRELYDCPIINYFEFFYHTAGSDVDFRPDFPNDELTRLRARSRNATLLLDLENCDAAYTPTQWQRDRLPALFHSRTQVIHDGIDTEFWKPRPGLPRRIGGRAIPDSVKLVTYVSRGFESMRGFDVFMKVAKTLCQRRDDVMFVVVGEDRCCYGGDEKVTGSKSFLKWVLAQDEYDLSRFLFLKPISPAALARLLAMSDLHVYLTVPFALSWSLLNAMSCGATVLASDTAPVREVVTHEQDGLLVDFFDVERFAETASRVLDNPAEFCDLGLAAVETIRERYSIETCLPQLTRLFTDVGSTTVNGEHRS